MKTVPVANPYDLSVVGESFFLDDNEVEQCLSKAANLFADAKQKLPAWRRIEILENFARLLSAEKESLAKLIAKEAGKPYKDALVEAERAANGVTIAINGIHNLAGKEIPMDIHKASAGRIAFTTYEPIGVVLAISAFNHPLNLIIHQTIPAVAAGCPVLVKPAPQTPLCANRIAELLEQAGLPSGWYQFCPCDLPQAQKLVSDSRIAFLTFIGSATVGWQIRRNIAPGTRISLEHGGAAPVIVNADTDMSQLVPALTKGGFYHAGQVCVSSQRIFAHHSIADKLAEALVKAAKNQKVGNPLDSDTDVGPLITPHEVKRVSQWVEEASTTSGVCMYGEQLSETLFSPTVLYNPPDDAKVSTLEIFGPVICIYPFREEQAAIQQANALPFAFQAAIFGKDIVPMLRQAKALDASAVMINEHTAFRTDWMPFAGRRASGLGVGGIEHTLSDMVQEKMLLFNHW